MFSFRSGKGTDTLNALVPDDTGLAVASVRQNRDGKPALLHCSYTELAPGQSLEDSLRQVISSKRLARAASSTLLGADDYQILMVESPEVPPTELKAAIRWRVRDLIDFHIDDAVLDIFDVPPSGARGVQEHIYAVVSRAAVVKERADRLQNAGVDLEFMDIPELALRNIAACLDQDAGGQATLHFSADRGQLILTRESTLFLARQLDIGYRQLQETPGLVDRLALEIQRSMDYYDRHFQQAPISTITLCPMPEGSHSIVDQLAQQTGITVHELQLDELVDCPTPVDHAVFAHSLLAIGAALRTESKQL